MAGKELVLDDFSGGVLQAGFPADFTTRQWQEIVGLVPEPTGLRSQWECQRVGGIDDVKSVRYLRTGTSNYLVVMRNDGSVWWRIEPNVSLSWEETAALTGWTQLTDGYRVEDDSAVTVLADSTLSMLCEMPVDRLVAKYQNGLLFNSASSDQAFVVHEDPATGNTLTARVYEGARRWPQYVVKDDLGNDVASGGTEWGAEGFMPPAHVGAMWGDVLCLGRSRWYRNLTAAANYQSNQLDDSKDKAFGTGIWTSYVSPEGRAVPDAFHPYFSWNMGFASPETAIGAMMPTDQGLLLFTTRGTQRDGVILLRGRPYDYVPVIVRGGIGVPLRPYGDGDMPGAAVEWPEAGGFAFMEHSGEVWFTDGRSADRADRVGPQPPGLADNRDHVAALRGTLFVSRDRELWALTLLDRSGDEGFAAWTQLVTPVADTQVRSMSVSSECLYFVQGGELFRFNYVSSDRGLVDGVPVVSRVTSPLLGEDGGPSRVRWSRVGVRAHGSGSIVSLSSSAGGLFDGLPAAPTLTTVVDKDLVGSTVSVVRGHGPSRTASVSVVFSGNVWVDGVLVWMMGAAGERTDLGRA